MAQERIWYRDPKGFLRPEGFLELIPDATLPYEARLNRVVRLSVYVSVVGYLVARDLRAVYPMVLAMAGSYFLHAANAGASEGQAGAALAGVERFARPERACTRPTKHNPFMNVTMNEYLDHPHRPAACPVPEVMHEIDANFHDTIFKEVDDVYQRSASIRNYHTVPSTTIPNAQDDFMRWCYGNPAKTCKEGNGLACKYFTPHK